MDTKLDYKLGFFFPAGGLGFGVVCVLFALGIIFTKDLNVMFVSISIFLILFGLTFFSRKHLVIDKVNQSIEEQTKCLGYTFRTKKDLNSFCYVSIIKQLYSVTSRTLIRQDITSEFGKYDLLLLNKPHHYKQKIGSFDNYEDAKKEAIKLSQYLGFDIVKFDPVRTRKSK